MPPPTVKGMKSSRAVRRTVSSSVVRLLVRGGNVEQHNFVRAGLGVSPGEFGGITGVAEIDELHAFHDAAGVDVEAGDDAFGQHVRSHRNSCRIVQPDVARFLRMKLHAEQMSALDRRREVAAVLAAGYSVGRLAARERSARNRQRIRCGNAAGTGVNSPRDFKLVPSHVR